MFAKSVSNGSLGKFQKVLIVALALLVLFAALPVGQASAWYYSQASGVRGNVTLPVISILEKRDPCFPVYGTMVCPSMLHLISYTGPTVYRSAAAAGAQIVQGMYVLEMWNGAAWTVIARSSIMQKQIGAYQNGVQFPTLTLTPQIGRGIFRVTWLFSWFNSGGARIGSAVISSNQASDHICSNPYRLCKSLPGYFQTGGLQTGAW